MSRDSFKFNIRLHFIVFILSFFATDIFAANNILNTTRLVDI